MWVLGCLTAVFTVVNLPVHALRPTLTTFVAIASHLLPGAAAPVLKAVHSGRKNQIVKYCLADWVFLFQPPPLSADGETLAANGSQQHDAGYPRRQQRSGGCSGKRPQQGNGAGGLRRNAGRCPVTSTPKNQQPVDL